MLVLIPTTPAIFHAVAGFAYSIHPEDPFPALSFSSCQTQRGLEMRESSTVYIF